MSHAEPARILLVDDHPLLRRGLADLLRLEEDLIPVAEAGSGQEAVDIATSIEPELDLILLDLNMPGLNGLETIRMLRNAGVDAKIIIFTVSDEHADLVEALREGADGYLLKDMEPEELVVQLRAAVQGRVVLSPELTHILAGAIKRRSGAQVQQLELTKRERDVLKHIAKGQSNKLIARNLDITEGTVKVHVKRLLHKLGVRSRTEAAVWVLEHNPPNLMAMAELPSLIIKGHTRFPGAQSERGAKEGCMIFADCSIALLAGGRGLRMGGVDKGWFKWQGKALIEHIQARVRPLTEELIISCNRNLEAYQPLADRLVTDSVPDFQGPLIGIIEAMRVARHEYLMVLPCDALRMDPLLLQQLYQARADRPVMYRQGDIWQPLFSILPIALLPELERLWAAGQRSPRDAFLALGTKALLIAQDDVRLANFNRPEMLL